MVVVGRAQVILIFLYVYDNFAAYTQNVFFCASNQKEKEVSVRYASVACSKSLFVDTLSLFICLLF